MTVQIVSPFELNTIDPDIDTTLGSFSGSGLSISSEWASSGTYSLKAVVPGAGSMGRLFQAMGGHAWMSVEMYISVLPDALSTFFVGGAALSLNADGTVDVYENSSTDVLLQAGVAALETNRKYRFEVEYDNTSPYPKEFRLDGKTIFSNEGLGPAETTIGANIFSGSHLGNAASVGTWYFDNLRRNSITAPDDSWVTPRSLIVVARPGNEGDADVGGPTRAGTDTGWFPGQLREVTPDDATTYVILPANPTDLWVGIEKPDALGIPYGSVINFVEVHARVAGATGNPTNWFPQLKAKPGGATVSGTVTELTSTTFLTNSGGSATTKLRSYSEPDNGGPWTWELLNSLQIGISTTDANPDTYTSTTWLAIEFVPPETPTIYRNMVRTQRFDIGMW